MVKVIIADDEVRICQLIQALVDWDGLGLEIAGVAHNGFEAIELVNRLRPDILITDIRMPGCSGLEMIERVKKELPELEIIVISGYAHFEYAQQALRFGVGDYLLKPVSRVELTATLEKLRARVCERRETRSGQEQLRRRSEKDVQMLQAGLVRSLVDQEESEPLTAAALAETYRFDARPGIFQAFQIRMDCGQERPGDSQIAVLMGKVREGLELALPADGCGLVLDVRDFLCAGFLNYEEKYQDEIRRAVKLSVNQLELQKNLFRPVSFSVALGRPCTDPGELGESMRDASVLIRERLVRGTGRLFERMGPPSKLAGSSVLERYLRAVEQAVEVLGVQQLGEAIDQLEREVMSVQDVRGCEVLETVYSAAEVFAARMQMAERAGYLEELHERCERCGSAREVFACLREMQCGYVERLAKQQENESVRPIRLAKQYIQEHYSEPITQEEVSGKVGLSPTYFSALFKKTEGEGFARYLINVRMEQAKILLRESNLPVAEICRRVGYNDLKHFTHTFEKAAGVKPGVYRKLYG